MITLQGLCSNLSRMQDAVSRWNLALQGARRRAHHAGESWANTCGRTAEVARHAAEVAEMQVGADEALEEYRDAVPKAAFVLTNLFQAANDPTFDAVPRDDRATTLRKLLAHGELYFGEIFEITGWPREHCEEAIERLLSDKSIVKIIPNGMQPTYALSRTSPLKPGE